MPLAQANSFHSWWETWGTVLRWRRCRTVASCPGRIRRRIAHSGTVGGCIGDLGRHGRRLRAAMGISMVVDRYIYVVCQPADEKMAPCCLVPARSGTMRSVYSRWFEVATLVYKGLERLCISLPWPFTSGLQVCRSFVGVKHILCNIRKCCPSDSSHTWAFSLGLGLPDLSRAKPKGKGVS